MYSVFLKRSGSNVSDMKALHLRSVISRHDSGGDYGLRRLPVTLRYRLFNVDAMVHVLFGQLRHHDAQNAIL